MRVENDDVKNGIVNGITGTFERIIFEKGAEPKPMIMHVKQGRIMAEMNRKIIRTMTFKIQLMIP